MNKTAGKDKKMTILKVLTFLATVVSFSLCGPNKTAGYYEYKYSLQRNLLMEKEKEFSRCCQKLSEVKFKFIFLVSSHLLLRCSKKETHRYCIKSSAARY